MAGGDELVGEHPRQLRVHAVRGDDLLTPASAYSKALVSFARAGRTAEAREAITAMGIVVTPLTAAIGEHAAQLGAAHERLRLPEAIVLATARVLDSKLLTYDDRLAPVTDNRDT